VQTTVAASQQFASRILTIYLDKRTRDALSPDISQDKNTFPGVSGKLKGLPGPVDILICMGHMSKGTSGEQLQRRISPVQYKSTFGIGFMVCGNTVKSQNIYTVVVGHYGT
jgi:hypothetical protein